MSDSTENVEPSVKSAEDVEHVNRFVFTKKSEVLSAALEGNKRAAEHGGGSGEHGRTFDVKFIQQALVLAESGLTEHEICRSFDISLAVFQLWKHEAPDLRKALIDGKAKFDQRIEHSLVQAALGYSHNAVQIFLNKEGDVVQVPYTKNYPPNVNAAALWLTNRNKKEWQINPGDLANKQSLMDKLDEMSKKLLPSPESKDGGDKE